MMASWSGTWCLVVWLVILRRALNRAKNHKDPIRSLRHRVADGPAFEALARVNPAL